MKTAKWDSTKRYESNYAPGVIPSDTIVKFVDGDTGRVINGNSSRSLVSYRPDRRTGMSEARDWFDNADLRIVQ